MNTSCCAAGIMRPEHLHYDYAEHWIQGSISSGEDFLYDPDLFRVELHNVSIKTGFPYEVRLASADFLALLRQIRLLQDYDGSQSDN